MGVFQFFKIVKVIPNRAKRLNSFCTTISRYFNALNSGLKRVKMWGSCCNIKFKWLRTPCPQLIQQNHLGPIFFHVLLQCLNKYIAE